MRQFLALNKRNIKLYFWDRSAVFFSTLSMLVVIVLMVLFLGNIANGSLLESVSTLPGRDPDTDAGTAKEIVYFWTIAGIITINAASVAHAFLSSLIRDRNDNRLNSIFVMPVKRRHITASFVFGAWLVSVIMGCLTLAITELIGVFRGFEAFSITAHLHIIFIILVNSFAYSAILFFLASIVRSESAWGAIGVIIGTLSGFFGGIYLAIGDLSENVVRLIKCFPFIYGTSALREVMVKGSEDTFFEGAPGSIRESVDAAMGNSLTLFENDLSGGAKVSILVVTGLVFMLVSTIIITYSKKKDR